MLVVLSVMQVGARQHTPHHWPHIGLTMPQPRTTSYTPYRVVHWSHFVRKYEYELTLYETFRTAWRPSEYGVFVLVLRTSGSVRYGVYP